MGPTSQSAQARYFTRQLVSQRLTITFTKDPLSWTSLQKPTFSKANMLSSIQQSETGVRMGSSAGRSPRFIIDGKSRCSISRPSPQVSTKPPFSQTRRHLCGRSHSCSAGTRCPPDSSLLPSVLCQLEGPAGAIKYCGSTHFSLRCKITRQLTKSNLFLEATLSYFWTTSSVRLLLSGAFKYSFVHNTNRCKSIRRICLGNHSERKI